MRQRLRNTMKKKKKKRKHDKEGCYHQAHPSTAKLHANTFMYSLDLTYGFV